MDQPIWLTFLVAFIFMNVLLVGMAYMTWYERKVLAAMQDRVGPNRTGPEGALAADRRRHQAARQGRPHPGPRRQGRLLLRAAGRLRRRDHAGRGDPLRRHHHRLRAARSISGSPISTSARSSSSPSARSASTASSSAATPRPTAIRCSAVSAPRPRSSPTRSSSACRWWASSSSRPRSASATSWSSRRGTSFSRSARSPDAAQLVHPLPAARLRDLLPRRRRRDEPRAVRPAGGGDGAGLRVPHRVLGVPLLVLLPGRIHQHDRRLALRGDAVPGRHRRAGLGPLLGAGHPLAPAEGGRSSSSSTSGCAAPCPVSATTS